MLEAYRATSRLCGSKNMEARIREPLAVEQASLGKEKPWREATLVYYFRTGAPRLLEANLAVLSEALSYVRGPQDTRTCCRKLQHAGHWPWGCSCAQNLLDSSGLNSTPWRLTTGSSLPAGNTIIVPEQRPHLLPPPACSSLETRFSKTLTTREAPLRSNLRPSQSKLL